MSKEAQPEEKDFEDLDSAIDAAFVAEEAEEVGSEVEEPTQAEEQVSDEGEPAEVEEPEVESESDEDVDTREASEETQADEPIEPPAFFNSEEKEAFKSYPREMQQAIDRVASGLRRRVSEDTQKLAPLRRLGEVLAPVVPELERLGIGPDQFISNLIRGRSLIQSDPLAGLEALGVDTQQLLNGMGQGESGAIPNVIQQRLGQVETFIQQQQQQADAREFQDRFSMARGFRDETDKEGRLLRPFLEVDPVTEQPRYPGFTQEMLTQVNILSNGGDVNRELLDKAYQRALRLSDDAQAVIEQKKKAQEVKKRQQSLAGKRNASSSISNNSSRSRGIAADEYDLDKQIDQMFATA